MFQRKEAFRVNKKISRQLKRRKQRIQYRLRDMHWNEQDKPMFSAKNIHYEIADRSRGLAYGGIGCMQLLAQQTGLSARAHQPHLPTHGHAGQRGGADGHPLRDPVERDPLQLLRRPGDAGQPVLQHDLHGPERAAHPTWWGVSRQPR